MKRIMSIVLTIMMIVCASSYAIAAPTGTYTEKNNMVKVTGQLTGDNPEGKEIYMMLIDYKVDGTVNAIKYVYNAITDQEGKYTFDFKLADEEVGKSVKNYKLKVNEAGDIDATHTVWNVEYDDTKIKIDLDKPEIIGKTESKTYDNRVYIKGSLGKSYINEQVIMMLVNPDSSDAPIGYIGMTKTDTNGDYEFKFRFNGEVSKYYVKVNKAGLEVTDTVVEAVAESEKLYSFETDFSKEKSEVSYDIAVMNNYGVKVEDLGLDSFMQILAAYSMDGALLDVKTETVSLADFEKDGENYKQRFSMTIPEGTDKVKAFIWKSVETLLPLNHADEMEIGAVTVYAADSDNSETVKIVCLGDSITYGSQAVDNQSYVTYFDDIIKCNAIKFGLSGSRVSKYVGTDLETDESFLDRYIAMDNDADIVTVLGGVNDCWGSNRNCTCGQSHFGAVTDEPGDTTFCGGYKLLLEKLIEKYPNAEIVCFTPLQATGSQFEGLNNYIEAIKSICSNYDRITLIDLYDESTLDFRGTSLMSDGVHPNEGAHEKIAKYMITQMEKQGVINIVD